MFAFVASIDQSLLVILVIGLVFSAAGALLARGVRAMSGAKKRQMQSVETIAKGMQTQVAKRDTRPAPQAPPLEGATRGGGGATVGSMPSAAAPTFGASSPGFTLDQVEQIVSKVVDRSNRRAFWTGIVTKALFFVLGAIIARYYPELKGLL